MDVPEIDVDQLARLVGDGAVVVDVRNPDEYVEGHVPGATLIPLGEVPDRTAEIPTDRPVFVVCAVGGRSLKASQYLIGLGVDATNVAGGTKGWIDAGHPVTTGEHP